MGASVGGRMRSLPLRRNGRYVGGCTLAGGAVVGRGKGGGVGHLMKPLLSGRVCCPVVRSLSYVFVFTWGRWGGGVKIDCEGADGVDADVEGAGVDVGVSVPLKISASCRRALS